MTSEDWKETELIINDLDELFGLDDDVNRVLQSISIRNQVLETYADVDLKAQDIIRQCAKQVEDSKRKAEDLAAVPANSPHIEKLKSEIEQAEKRLKEQEEKQTSTELEVKELTEKIANLELDLASLKKGTSIQVPVMKHSLSLYANITKVKWDFSSDKIAGSVVDPDSGVVQDFSLDETKMSPFCIANHVWDIIST